MYSAAVLLVICILLTIGGWADIPQKRDLVKRLLFLTGLSVLVWAPSISVRRGLLYPAEMVLLLTILATERAEHPFRVLFWTITCGLAGWKLYDWFPLFPESSVLFAMPAAAICAVRHMDRGGEHIVLTAAPIVSLLCIGWMDLFLFRYASFMIGSPTGLTATLLGGFFVSGMRQIPRVYAAFQNGFSLSRWNLRNQHAKF